jgi:hypothetical protein
MGHTVPLAEVRTHRVAPSIFGAQTVRAMGAAGDSEDGVVTLPC